MNAAWVTAETWHGHAEVALAVARAELEDAGYELADSDRGWDIYHPGDEVVVKRRCAVTVLRDGDSRFTTVRRWTW